VRLGLRPEFSHLIGADPGRHLGVTGMGCGPKGELYAFSFSRAPSTHYVHSELKAYDRDGNHLRQLMPYTAGLPAEKRKATKWIDIPDGPQVPMVHHGSGKSLYPEMGAGGVNILVRGDGKLVLVNGGFRDKPHFQRRVLLLGPDGSTDENYLGPILAVSGMGGMFLTALSPDGKTLYVSGYRNGKSGAPVPAVYTTTWESKSEPKEFLGADTVSEPRGVATDPKGNVYVADHGKGCVSIFSPNGKQLGELPAKHADLVAVHPKTGAVYVMCTTSDPKKNHTRSWASGSNYQVKTLLKFDGPKAGGPAFSLALVKRSSPARPKMALDSSGAQPVIWVAGLMWGKNRIRKIVDVGGKFEEAPTSIYAASKGAVRGGYLDIAVAYDSDELFVSSPPGRSDAGLSRYEGTTGKFLGAHKINPRMARGHWGQPAVSWDGKAVVYLPPMDKLGRFTLDGKPANWPGLDTHLVNGMQQGFIRPRGHCPTPDGGAYVLHHPQFRAYSSGCVTRVGPDGKTTKDVVKLACPVGGIKVDPQGNIYVGAFVLPKGKTLPDCFEGKLPGTLKQGPKWFYSNLYGTLLKFKPSGGALVKADDGQFTAGVSFRRHPVKAEGLLWSHYGLSPMPSRYTGCSCQTPRFDVDRFGRVFVPDTLRFSVKVLDGSGAQIGRFGHYGNLDDALADTKANGNARIHTAWPHALAVTDKMVYVADMLNHHVVAVKLAAAAEETASLR
jgi:DNA-binding beta-propeller fold protein YncE